MNYAMNLAPIAAPQPHTHAPAHLHVVWSRPLSELALHSPSGGDDDDDAMVEDGHQEVGDVVKCPTQDVDQLSVWVNVALAIVEDPEPLLTLARRLHRLRRLSLVSTTARNAVDEIATPAMVRRYVRSSYRDIGAYDTLANMDDDVLAAVCAALEREQDEQPAESTSGGAPTLFRGRADHVDAVRRHVEAHGVGASALKCEIAMRARSRLLTVEQAQNEFGVDPTVDGGGGGGGDGDGGGSVFLYSAEVVRDMAYVKWGGSSESMARHLATQKMERESRFMDMILRQTVLSRISYNTGLSASTSGGAGGAQTYPPTLARLRALDPTLDGLVDRLIDAERAIRAPRSCGGSADGSGSPPSKSLMHSIKQRVAGIVLEMEGRRRKLGRVVYGVRHLLPTAFPPISLRAGCGTLVSRFSAEGQQRVDASATDLPSATSSTGRKRAHDGDDSEGEGEGEGESIAELLRSRNCMSLSSWQYVENGERAKRYVEHGDEDALRRIQEYVRRMVDVVSTVWPNDPSDRYRTDEDRQYHKSVPLNVDWAVSPTFAYLAGTGSLQSARKAAENYRRMMDAVIEHNACVAENDPESVHFVRHHECLTAMSCYSMLPPSAHCVISSALRLLRIGLIHDVMQTLPEVGVFRRLSHSEMSDYVDEVIEGVPGTTTKQDVVQATSDMIAAAVAAHHS